MLKCYTSSGSSSSVVGSISIQRNTCKVEGKKTNKNVINVRYSILCRDVSVVVNMVA